MHNNYRWRCRQYAGILLLTAAYGGADSTGKTGGKAGREAEGKTG
jgi:hypothetical protein